jgi:hypothetical protein
VRGEFVERGRATEPMPCSRAASTPQEPHLHCPNCRHRPRWSIGTAGRRSHKAAEVAYSRRSSVTHFCRGRSVPPSSSATARRQAPQGPLADDRPAGGPCMETSWSRSSRPVCQVARRSRRFRLDPRPTRQQHRRRRPEPSAPRHGSDQAVRLKPTGRRAGDTAQEVAPEGTFERAGNAIRFLETGIKWLTWRTRRSTPRADLRGRKNRRIE